MTATLRSTLDLQLGWTWQDHADTTPVIDDNRLVQRTLLTESSVDVVWHSLAQSLSDATATTLELDLLTRELFGDTLTISLARVRVIVVLNQSDPATGGELVVGAAAVDPWYAPFGDVGATIRVAPGSPLVLAELKTGWEVATGANSLQLAASGGPVTYDLAILGNAPGEESSSSSSSSS